MVMLVNKNNIKQIYQNLKKISTILQHITCRNKIEQCNSIPSLPHWLQQKSSIQCMGGCDLCFHHPQMVTLLLMGLWACITPFAKMLPTNKQIGWITFIKPLKAMLKE